MQIIFVNFLVFQTIENYCFEGCEFIVDEYGFQINIYRHRYRMSIAISSHRITDHR